MLESAGVVKIGKMVVVVSEMNSGSFIDVCDINTRIKEAELQLPPSDLFFISSGL